MISDANRLISSVYSYSTLNYSSSVSGGVGDRQNPSIQSPPARAQKSPSSLEGHLEIDRINRLCEVADRNIRATESDLRELPRMISSAMDGSDEPLNDNNRNAPSAPKSPIRIPKRSRRIANLDPEPEHVISLSNSLQTPLSPSRNSTNVINTIDLCTPPREIVGVRRRRTTQQTPRNIDSRNPEQDNSPSIGRTSITRSRSSSIIIARPKLTCFVQTSTTSIGDSTQPQTNKNSTLSPSESSSASSLKTVAPSDSSNNGHTPLMCAVCMESCLNNMPTSTKCGHVFCANCINQAMRLKRKCPMCKTKLSSRMLFRIYV